MATQNKPEEVPKPEEQSEEQSVAPERRLSQLKNKKLFGTPEGSDLKDKQI